ncbi:sigma factor [Streptosporangium longisporum]|uniref:RNA polymerase sigma-70 region 2 domain-containing protein n=1 Tax=Streptosporangium longisporum TaxID=46187 RepID=A0ABN3XWA1_9ACTN
MIDSVLVEALRAREPGALVALYDAYAEGVYRYCRSMLATPEDAQAAFLGAFVAAEAHVHALSDPRRLEAWLYALARQECVRRVLAEAPGTRAPAPEVTGGDADLRVMAWNATRSLSPGDREVLDLSCRHGFGPLDLGAVLGVGTKAAGALYESARERLRDVVTAEVLVRKGPYDCASRARLLTGFGGELTPEARERVIRHVNRCDTCAPHRVRQVSAAKVFDLLPVDTLPPALRERVMDCFSDPGQVPYRRDVAHRAGPLDDAGFPAGRSPRARRSRVAAGTAVAIAAAAAAVVLVLVQSLADPAGPGVASGGLPAVVEPPSGHRPWEPGRGADLTPGHADEASAVELVGSLGSAWSSGTTGSGPQDGPFPGRSPGRGPAGEGAEDPASPAERAPRDPGERSPRNAAEPPADGPRESPRPPAEGPPVDGPPDRQGGPPPPVGPPAPPPVRLPPVPPSSESGPDGRRWHRPPGRLPHRHHHGHRSSRFCELAQRPPGRPESRRADQGSPRAGRGLPTDGARRWRRDARTTAPGPRPAVTGPEREWPPPRTPAPGGGKATAGVRPVPAVPAGVPDPLPPARPARRWPARRRPARRRPARRRPASAPPAARRPAPARPARTPARTPPVQRPPVRTPPARTPAVTPPGRGTPARTRRLPGAAPTRKDEGRTLADGDVVAGDRHGA